MRWGLQEQDSGHGQGEPGKEAKEGFWAAALSSTGTAGHCFPRDWGLSNTESLAEEQGGVGTED